VGIFSIGIGFSLEVITQHSTVRFPKMTCDDQEVTYGKQSVMSRIQKGVEKVRGRGSPMENLTVIEFLMHL